jgi:protein tyrosine/serine phosphatase
VQDGLIYRSGRIHPRLIDGVLEEHAIEVVVNLAARGEVNDAMRAERDAVGRRGLRLVELDGLDGSGIGDLENYVTALTEMAAARREQRPILVHCAAGTQRTGAAVGWFRMLFDGWSGADAYDEYMSYRYYRPDSGKLERYMNRHVQRLVERLVETGALLAAPETAPRFGPGH